MNELVLLAVSQSEAPVGSGMVGLFPLVLMFLIFYFLLIRPQQKRQKEHKKMLSLLKKGDRVVTNGGLIGQVFALTDNEIVVQIADRVKVRVLRTQVNLYALDEGTEKDK